MRILGQFLVGLVVSVLVGWVAYRRRSLNKSGVAGAMLFGTAIWGSGGWVWGLLLITFFVLSSLLSHYKASAKESLAEKFDKGSRRDFGQTFANAGAGTLIALAFLFYSQPILLAAFVGAIATVNADTWATELGVLSKRPPRLVTTWKRVAPGTSGGVSLLGTLATSAGALCIGLALLLFLWIDALLGGAGFAHAGASGVWILPASMLGGLAGSLFDSLLGATIQAMYYSSTRQKETEKKIDPDGTPNTLTRGWHWLGNDTGNFISSFGGALVSAFIYVLLR